MPDFYDRFESRTPAARQNALFRDLRHVLTVAKPRSPALRAQLKGIKVQDLAGPADLAAIPVRRRADLLEAQEELPPFGGYATTRLGATAQCFVSSDGLASPCGPAKDWFGLARALHGAGLTKGELILNCFGYELEPRGHMVEAGARALTCPVLPAGSAPVEAVCRAAMRLKPNVFCGPAERLKALLDHADDIGGALPSLTRALVTGPLTAGLRSELSLRGIRVRLMHLSEDLGLVAFETGDWNGLVLAEGLILEIIPSPANASGDGEMVVTRINADYPLLRFATGDMSAVLREGSPCGRTNVMIRPPHRAANGAAVLAEILRHHPDLGRMRLFLRRPRGHDEPHLQVEHRDHAPPAGSSLRDALAETLLQITALRGTVEIVRPGSLPDDDRVVVDERADP